MKSFNGGAEGTSPNSALIQASDGNFYGSTRTGGAGYGTVFQVTPAGVLTTLQTFSGGRRRRHSGRAAHRGTAGVLFSTTTDGGANGLGGVVRLGIAEPKSITVPGDFDGDGKDDIAVYSALDGQMVP